MQSHILFSWIGDKDLEAPEKNNQFGALYSIYLSNIAPFNKIILLTNRNNDKIQGYISWLKYKLSDKKISIYLEEFTENDDPTDYQFIYKKSEYTINKYQDSNSLLYFNLTSGTPTMSATWLLLGTSIFKATLIQSSIQKGVEIVEVPYEISLKDKQDKTIANISSNLLIDTFDSNDGVMHKVDEFIQLFAPRNIPIIIQGETGTGKEVLAKKIHNTSHRKNQPFIAINCGAISENLIDSELFGHKKGSFTGAYDNRKGHFEKANKGTLFLDEIGELPLASQVKLLRVLQEYQVTPIGSSEPIEVDVRIICATHRDLLQMIQDGQFREDLYYRLAVGMIEIPPLRQRGKDIISLSHDLINEINNKLSDDNFTKKSLSACAIDFIINQHWTGNVRELQNTLLRACVYYPNIPKLTQKHISSMMIDSKKVTTNKESIDIQLPIDAPKKVKEIKKMYAEAALKLANNRKNRAGKLLNISSQVLDNWIL